MTLLKLWCIHTSSWFFLDHLGFIWWSFLIGVAFLASSFLACISSFIVSMNGIPVDTSALIYEPFFEDSYHRILKTLILQMFLPFDDGGLPWFFNHDQLFFYHGWCPVIGMLLLHKYFWAICTPCSYILEDISNHAFCSISTWSYTTQNFERKF